jgi:hypothetical protein
MVAQHSVLHEHQDNNAPDDWDCARFWEIILNFSSFPYPSFILPSRR